MKLFHSSTDSRKCSKILLRTLGPIPPFGTRRRLLWSSSTSTTRLPMTAKSIGFPYVRLSPLSSLLADIFDGVLHPRFKKFYFIHHKWLQGWIDEANGDPPIRMGSLQASGSPRLRAACFTRCSSSDRRLASKE